VFWQPPRPSLLHSTSFRRIMLTCTTSHEPFVMLELCSHVGYIAASASLVILLFPKL
jgi:hypothetical protein